MTDPDDPTPHDVVNTINLLKDTPRFRAEVVGVTNIGHGIATVTTAAAEAEDVDENVRRECVAFDRFVRRYGRRHGRSILTRHIVAFQLRVCRFPVFGVGSIHGTPPLLRTTDARAIRRWFLGLADVQRAAYCRSVREERAIGRRQRLYERPLKSAQIYSRPA